MLTAPIDAESLIQFDFYPNRLGADNLLACRLSGIGFALANPCEELPTVHAHCDPSREYLRTRIDAHSFSVNARGENCFMWPTPKVSVQSICRNLTDPSFAAAQAARLRAADARSASRGGGGANSRMACGEGLPPASLRKLQTAGCVPAKLIHQ